MKKMNDSEKDTYEGTNGVVRHHLTSHPVSMVIVLLLTTPLFMCYTTSMTFVNISKTKNYKKGVLL